MRQPNERIRRVIRKYNHQNGLAPVVEGHYVVVDKELATTIATTYDGLPTWDTSAKDSYTALRGELLAQYHMLIAETGIVFEAWQGNGQPYNNSTDMCEDIRNNNHMWYFTDGEPHPYLDELATPTMTYNHVFRCVHDLFGHAAEGYQFGARGEENAWIHHSMMFSSLAQRALTTETRGQNSWVNFGQFSALPVQDRPFATQKVALLPIELTDYKQALERGNQ